MSSLFWSDLRFWHWARSNGQGLCSFSFKDGHCSSGAPNTGEEGVAWFGGVNQVAFCCSPCMFTIQRPSFKLLS
jgi:hypothetical protein